MATAKSKQAIKIHLRLALYTNFGPVGTRLRRGDPLPEGPIDFDTTPEGFEQAKEALARWQRYCDRSHGK
jgi:hypothetical protein